MVQGEYCEYCAYVVELVPSSLNDRSGRLAFLGARSYNTLAGDISKASAQTPLAASPFQYIISGGDEALIAAKESVEDSAVDGQRQLQALLTSDALEGTPVMFIGITCGMSAPFVAGVCRDLIAVIAMVS